MDRKRLGSEKQCHEGSTLAEATCIFLFHETLILRLSQIRVRILLFVHHLLFKFRLAGSFPKTCRSVLAHSWLSSNRAWKNAPGGCDILRHTRYTVSGISWPYQPCSRAHVQQINQIDHDLDHLDLNLDRLDNDVDHIYPNLDRSDKS